MNTEMFKLVVDNIPNPMWIKDKELRFIYANDEYIKIFNKKCPGKYNIQCIKVIETKEVIIEEGYSMDGVYRRCTIFPLVDGDGKVESVAAIYANIDIVTKRDRVIEEQQDILKVIVDTLPGKVFYKNTDSEYVYVNNEYKNMHIENGVDDLIGKTDFDTHLTEEQAIGFVKSDREVIEDKKCIFISAVHKDKRGNETYSETIKKPVIDKNGDVIGIVGFAMDVTEKKKTEDKLRYLSYTDSLTEVYNRAYFDERAKELSDEKYYPLGVIMGDANGLKVINDTLGHLEGDNLLRTVADILKDTCSKKGEVFRIGGDEFVILIPNSSQKDCEILIRSILNTCKSYSNQIVNISISLGESIKYSVDKDIYVTLKEAEDKVYRQKLLNEKSIRSGMINSLKKGLAAKSMETEEHTERILEKAIKIGERLNLSISEIDELVLVAKLHDIGKIGISEEILLKPGKLTNEEFEIIKTHTEKGYRIVKASSELDSVANGVLSHHERWDGKGYPLGLSGKEIPLVSRIVCVIDSYDVMRHNRAYKKAMSKEAAIEELQRCSGTQFDAEIVDIFIEYLKEC